MVESLGNIGQVTSKSSEVENISQKYYDTSTRVEALEIEQARLLEMLSNASEIESMIAIFSFLKNWFKQFLNKLPINQNC